VSHFFGLDDKDKEVQLEELFILTTKMNVSYTEFFKIPVRIRRWLIKRLVESMTPKTENPMQDMDRPLSTTQHDS
jgi:hypothetical protein